MIKSDSYTCYVKTRIDNKKNKNIHIYIKKTLHGKTTDK